MKKNEILKLIENQTLFFDGGTGSVLQSWGLQPGELPEIWNITNPDKIIQLHYEYFLAGANIIKTNTFGANKNKFKDSEFSLEEIVSSALNNAKKAKENGYKTHPRFSPGYGDLSLKTQSIFFRLLNCTQKIGLTLMDSFIMAPEKSITAFIGLEKEKEN